MAEQLAVVDTVPDTAVRLSTATTVQLVELPSMTVPQQIHSLQSKVTDIVPSDWWIDFEWAFVLMTVVDSLERIQMLVIWVRERHIRFEFVVALAGLDSLSTVVDGQDLVEFEFVLGFVAFVTLKQHLAKSFAVRVDAVESTNFALPRLCADARSNNAWQIEIQLTSNSCFAVVDVDVQ